MNKFYKILLVIVTSCLSGFAISQNCIDYGEFNEPPCVCTPPGWDGILNAEEFDDITSYGPCYSLHEESPSGGTAVALDITGPGFSEGINTTITGLTPNVEYSLVFWWASITLDCGGGPVICCADLSVEVDGQVTIFPSSEEWTLAEVCITPESSSIDIELLGIHNGIQGFIVIDDAACEEAVLSCCGLGLVLEEEAAVCPNEDLQIESEILNAIGNVTIEWSADPPEAIDYLSATDIANPIFNYPLTGNEFDGLVITYTMFIEDDACEVEKEIIIEVFAYDPVSFSFLNFPYCEIDNEVFFPTQSDEGITGTWTPESLDVSDHGSESFEITFIANEGEVLCPIEFTFDIEVETFVLPSFDFPLIVCRSEHELIELPEESLEGIEGSWNIDEINIEDWSDSEIELVFTPDDLFCTEVLELEMELTTGEQLSFSLSTQFCKNDSSFTLDDEDLNGVDGVWDNATIDLSVVGQYQSTFIAADDEECYAPFEFAYEVLDQLEYSFDIDLPICKKNSVITLDSSSLEGIVGFWNIQSFNPDTIAADSIVVIWNALENQGECENFIELTLDFVDPQLPDFILPDSLCKNDELYIFQKLSENGIEGTWTIDEFIPSQVQNSFIESIFIPYDSICADTIRQRIELYDPLVPQFNFASSICIFDFPLILPNISSNGIEGTWSNNPLELDGNNIINSIFIPLDNCAESVDVSWDVDFEVTALFDLPDYLCQDSEPYLLPVISDNGISGNWIPTQIDPSQYSSGVAEPFFIPDAIFCADTIIRSMEIIDVLPLEYTVVQPSGCNASDGNILFENLDSGIEYSLDNGMSWNVAPELLGLGDGDYGIQYRLIDRNLCIDSLSLTLNSMGAPVLENLDFMDQTSCLDNNGWIRVESQGNDLQYSIDDGNSWQLDGLFTDLGAGEYIIIVQEVNSPDCNLEVEVILAGPQNTRIDSVEISAVSDCMISDASIEIIAGGNNLEYSIDGINWQTNPLFQDLSPGEYVAMVRSSDQTDCNDELLVFIKELNAPVIEDLVVIPSRECNDNIGSVVIEASGIDLEYSIDNGLNWTSDINFDMLPSGEYEIIVRESEYNGCVDNLEFRIALIEESLLGVELLIDSISICDVRDGQIEIVGIGLNLEYSLDGGINWQLDNVFSNLGPGDYDLFVQQTGSIGCDTLIEFELINPQCPCIDLATQFEIRPITCEDLNNGSIDLIDIGIDDYSVIWSNGEQSNLIENLEYGWYYVSITYENDCIWVDSVYMSEFDPINFGIVGLDSDCEGSNNGSLTVIDVLGGSGVYNYSIDGEVYIDENVFFNLSPDEYEVFVLDANNCIASDFYEIAVANILDFKLDSTLLIEQGESIFLNPLLIEGEIDSFVWHEGNMVLQSNNLYLEVSPQETTSYQLTVYYGPCVQYFNIIIEVKKLDDLYLGNIFNPESISENSRIYLQSKSDSEIVVNEFIIYDRWGNKLFHKEMPQLNSPDDGWDGYYNNERVNPGVFVYYVEYVLDGEIKSLASSFSLIR